VFPLLVTFFIFILFHNWMGLIPALARSAGVTRRGRALPHDATVDPPHNADFNGTIALALISFGAWAIIVFKYCRPKLILWDLFGNKADKKETPGWLYPILALVFVIVGFIEVFSISIRPSPFRSVSSATSSAVKISCTAPASSSCSISWSCSWA
jgi:F-type H+-transporting ATPase subunit a